MNRKKAREEAFILIFEKNFNNDSCDDILNLAQQVRDFESDSYIENVFKGVYDNLELIDGIISEYSKGWSLKRISKTSLCVLRLSIYEIKFIESIPEAVSINEAVELCKKYATAEDSAFVNGILSSVVKANA